MPSMKGLEMDRIAVLILSLILLLPVRCLGIPSPGHPPPTLVYRVFGEQETNSWLILEPVKVEERYAILNITYVKSGGMVCNDGDCFYPAKYRKSVLVLVELPSRRMYIKGVSMGYFFFHYLALSNRSIVASSWHLSLRTGRTYRIPSYWKVANSSLLFRLENDTMLSPRLGISFKVNESSVFYRLRERIGVNDLRIRFATALAEGYPARLLVAAEQNSGVLISLSIEGLSIHIYKSDIEIYMDDSQLDEARPLALFEILGIRSILASLYLEYVDYVPYFRISAEDA